MQNQYGLEMPFPGHPEPEKRQDMTNSEARALRQTVRGDGYQVDMKGVLAFPAHVRVELPTGELLVLWHPADWEAYKAKKQPTLF